MKRPVTPRPGDLAAPPRIRLGQHIRELRVDAEMSCRELAHRLGSHEPVVRRMERGQHTVTLLVLERVADVLELDVPTIAVVLDDAWAEGAQQAQEARHEGDDPWSRYERRKAELASTACSTAEYELELGRIADEEGV